MQVMSSNGTPELRVDELTPEYAATGSPLATTRPRLSWRVAPGPRDWTQARFDLRLERAGGVVVEHTGHGRESVLVAWPFAELEPRERASVSVRVHGSDGSVSQWSQPALLEVGLLGS